MAQWITRLTTDQKIPGSTPGRLELFFSHVEQTFILYNVFDLHIPKVTNFYHFKNEVDSIRRKNSESSIY